MTENPQSANESGEAAEPGKISLEGPLSESLAETEKLIELIRNTSGEALDRFGSIEETLEAASACVAQVLGAFTGAKVSVEADGVALFGDQFSDSGEAPPLNCARIMLGEENPVCHVAMTPGEFRAVMSAGFGQGGEGGLQDQQPLSFAEQKIFLRLCDRLAANFFSAFLQVDDDEVPLKPKACEPSEVAEVLRGTEPVLVTFAAAFAGETVNVSAIFPFDALEGEVNAEAVDQLDPDSGDDGAEQAAANWKERMAQVVSELQIPLVAELAVRELPLSEVNTLEIGRLPGFEFNMNKVRLLDAEARPVLHGSIQVREGRLEFRVAREAQNHAA